MEAHAGSNTPDTSPQTAPDEWQHRTQTTSSGACCVACQPPPPAVRAAWRTQHHSPAGPAVPFKAIRTAGFPERHTLLDCIVCSVQPRAKTAFKRPTINWKSTHVQTELTEKTFSGQWKRKRSRGNSGTAVLVGPRGRTASNTSPVMRDHKEH
ncbi:unnamed protein product [Gadus morhua 'NCC']